jgi:hypothetical protein
VHYPVCGCATQIPSDLDYLDTVRPLRTWLGFSVIRNPYTVALAMEKRPVTTNNNTSSSRNTVTSKQAATGLISTGDDTAAMMPLGDTGFSTVRATKSTLLHTNATQASAV